MYIKHNKIKIKFIVKLIYSSLNIKFKIVHTVRDLLHLQTTTSQFSLHNWIKRQFLSKSTIKEKKLKLGLLSLLILILHLLVSPSISFSLSPHPFLYFLSHNLFIIPSFFAQHNTYFFPISRRLNFHTYGWFDTMCLRRTPQNNVMSNKIWTPLP